MNRSATAVEKSVNQQTTLKPVEHSAQRKLDFTQPDQYIDVGPSDLAYWRTGTGPDLVFIHGWPVHSATYRNLIPKLAPYFTCHIFDLPGTGMAKASVHTQYDFYAHVNALRTALQTLGITQYGIVAHDSGAVIARILADQEPNAVVGLSMSGSEIPGYYSPLLKFLFGIVNLPGNLIIFAKLLRLKFFRHSIIGFGSCFYDKTKIEGEFFKLFIEPFSRNKAHFTGQMQIAHTVTFSELDKLKAVHQRLKMPVQLIWGDKDPFFPARKAETMLEDLPKGSSFHLINNARTFVHEEYPEPFSNLVREFMETKFVERESLAS